MVCEKWQESIVSTDKTMAIVLLILNIFFPGLGTLINAFMGDGVVGDQVLVALLQWLTAICIVGWIWAIWWGILMTQKARG